MVLQRSRSHLNADNISIFTTPRRLIHSLQEPNDVDSDFSEKGSRRFRSPCSRNFVCSPDMKFNRNGFQHNAGYEDEENRNSYAGGEQFQDTSESVSSTDDIPADAHVQVSPGISNGNKEDVLRFCRVKNRWKSSYRSIIGLFLALLAIFSSLVWIDGQDQGRYLVPT